MCERVTVYLFWVACCYLLVVMEIDQVWYISFVLRCRTRANWRLLKLSSAVLSFWQKTILSNNPLFNTLATV